MNTVTIHGKTFVKSIDHKEIVEAVENLAAVFNRDFAEVDNILFIGILNGSFMFAAELMKNIELPCEITFVRMNSYSGINSTGKVKTVLGLQENIKGRNVVVLEDIIETGATISAIEEELIARGAGTVFFASLFYKPTRFKGVIRNIYAVIDIPDDFIVGFGLDYNGLGRNLKDIYRIKE